MKFQFTRLKIASAVDRIDEFSGVSAVKILFDIKDSRQEQAAINRGEFQEEPRAQPGVHIQHMIKPAFVAHDAIGSQPLRALPEGGQRRQDTRRALGAGRSSHGQPQCRWRSAQIPPPRCYRATRLRCGPGRAHWPDSPRTKSNQNWPAGRNPGRRRHWQRDWERLKRWRKAGFPGESWSPP